MRQEVVSEGAVVGGSEIAAVLGLSPYKAPIDLWLEKRGDAPPFDGNERTDWGNDVEPAIRQWYANRTGREIYWPPRSLFHPEHAWMRATPDGIVLAEGGRWDHGFEAKNVGRRQSHRWGEPGSDEVPVEYLLQAQQGMAVTGLRRWDIAAVIAGDPPQIFPVERDDELIETMVSMGADFVRSLETGTPPPADATEAYASYLARRYPFAREALVKATTEVDGLVGELAEKLAACADLDMRIEEIKNILRDEIRDAAGLDTHLGKIWWKPRRGAPNWKRVAEELATLHDVADDELAQLAATFRNQDSRPLNLPRSVVR